MSVKFYRNHSHKIWTKCIASDVGKFILDLRYVTFYYCSMCCMRGIHKLCWILTCFLVEKSQIQRCLHDCRLGVASVRSWRILVLCFRIVKGSLYTFNLGGWFYLWGLVIFFPFGTLFACLQIFKSIQYFWCKKVVVNNILNVSIKCVVIFFFSDVVQWFLMHWSRSKMK